MYSHRQSSSRNGSLAKRRASPSHSKTPPRTHKSTQPFTPTKQQMNLVDYDSFGNLLDQYGSFPSKYRMQIWSHLLNLPHSKSAFDSLKELGPHDALHHIPSLYPVNDPKLAKRFHRIMALLAHWSPACADVGDDVAEYEHVPPNASHLQNPKNSRLVSTISKKTVHVGFVPKIVYPFVRVIENDQECVEVLITLMTNTFREWFESIPSPPLRVLSRAEMLLKEFDNELLEHFRKFRIGSETYIWLGMKTLFSDVFSKAEWTTLMDHVIFNKNSTTLPDFLTLFAVALCIVSRESLLRLHSTREFVFFFTHYHGLSIDRIIRTTYCLRKHTPPELTARLSSPPYPATFEPIPQGCVRYPVFTHFPTAFVENEVNLRVSEAHTEAQLLKRMGDVQKTEKQRTFAEADVTMRKKERDAIRENRKHAKENFEARRAEERIKAGRVRDAELGERMRNIELMNEEAQNRLEELRKDEEERILEELEQMEIEKEQEIEELKERRAREQLVDFEETARRRMEEVEEKFEEEEAKNDIVAEGDRARREMENTRKRFTDEWRREDEEKERIGQEKMREEEMRQRQKVAERMKEKMRDESNRLLLEQERRYDEEQRRREAENEKERQREMRIRELREEEERGRKKRDQLRKQGEGIMSDLDQLRRRRGDENRTQLRRAIEREEQERTARLGRINDIRDNESLNEMELAMAKMQAIIDAKSRAEQDFINRMNERRERQNRRESEWKRSIDEQERITKQVLNDQISFYDRLRHAADSGAFRPSGSVEERMRKDHARAAQNIRRAKRRQKYEEGWSESESSESLDPSDSDDVSVNDNELRAAALYTTSTPNASRFSHQMEDSGLPDVHSPLLPGTSFPRPAHLDPEKTQTFNSHTHQREMEKERQRQMRFMEIDAKIAREKMKWEKTMKSVQDDGEPVVFLREQPVDNEVFHSPQKQRTIPRSPIHHSP
ncbi:putative TBC1 domain family member 31 [Blattamonas nauphoetae]|uniref:TBC1 domain family member 31 n=1 Tax=Blattamonas nauphoetae TaxID=2049346 RepID=A0ABQ9XXM3_9EUKA|nr:putative TBC1 domain family member 31 [Blattamonas nauphoetae]